MVMGCDVCTCVMMGDDDMTFFCKAYYGNDEQE